MSEEGVTPIQRINFIEREPFQLTQRKMVLVGGAILGLGILFYGVQLLRTFSIEKKTTVLAEEVGRLKSDRERLLKSQVQESQGPQANTRSVLAQLLTDSTNWSGLLKNVTLQAPPNLWLTHLKSYEKQEDPGKRAILLEGNAEEAPGVARFIDALSKSKQFDHVILTSLKQQKGPAGENYEFAMSMNLTSSSSNKARASGLVPAPAQQQAGGGKKT